MSLQVTPIRCVCNGIVTWSWVVRTDMLSHWHRVFLVAWGMPTSAIRRGWYSPLRMLRFSLDKASYSCIRPKSQCVLKHGLTHVQFPAIGHWKWVLHLLFFSVCAWYRSKYFSSLDFMNLNVGVHCLRSPKLKPQKIAWISVRCFSSIIVLHFMGQLLPQAGRMQYLLKSRFVRSSCYVTRFLPLNSCPFSFRFMSDRSISFRGRRTPVVLIWNVFNVKGIFYFSPNRVCICFQANQNDYICS